MEIAMDPASKPPINIDYSTTYSYAASPPSPAPSAPALSLAHPAAFATMLLITVIALLPFSLAAVPKLKERADVTCSQVHLFLARGNGEAYPGRVGAIANTVCSGLPSCTAENILFDSSQGYCDQASDGVASGLSQIAAYSALCPDTKIVLGGYSLGAHIVGDILGGGGGDFYDCVEKTTSGLNPSSGPGSHSEIAQGFRRRICIK
jgi:acetylxylan esterase